MSFIGDLNWRYATKKFDGRKVQAEILDKILTAIQYTPSSFGIQPYHIVIIENYKLKEKLNLKVFWDQKQIVTCSHLLVFCEDLDIAKRAHDFVALAAASSREDIANDPGFDYEKGAVEHSNKMGDQWAAKQAYLALGFALAACAELKVDSCPMEAADFTSIKEILDLPKNLEPKVLLPIGYRSADDKHAKDLKIRFSKEKLFGIKK